MTSETEFERSPVEPSSRQAFGDVLQALADPIVVADTSNRIVHVNAASERLLGWSAADLMGQPLTVIQPPRLRPAHLAAFDRYVETGIGHIIGRPINVPALHRDGTEIDVELMIGVTGEGDSRLFVASLRDLRDRVELERQLAVARYLRATTDAAARLTSLLDFDAVLDTVIDTLVNDFDAALARIWLAEPNSRTLYLRAQGGSANPPGETRRNALHAEALPLWIDQVARSGSVFTSNDLAGDPRFEQEWVEREGISALAAFPLLLGRDVHGVMVLFSHRSFPPELLDVLGSFAAIVAASLNDVQLFVREQEARADAEEARQRFAFLAEASRVLAASLEYETTLHTIAQLVVPHLADWCIVDVMDAAGIPRRLSVAHADPERLQVAREFRRRYPPERERGQVAVRVMHSGEPVIVREITAPMMDRFARDAEHRELLDTLGLRSFMCVPLIAHGRVQGALSFVSAKSGRRYGDADLALAEDLARRVAIAVDNAHLYRELQEAIRMRDEFLSSVSHDLKNPIAAIKGRAQMLRRRAAMLPGEQGERLVQGLEHIDATGTRMTRIINDLVDVARLRMGQPLELDSTPVDLLQLVRQAIREQQSGNGSGRIEVCSPLETLEGNWDASRLERVLINLLSNAVKYSPEGGEIIVDVRREERESGLVAVVVVRDQGIGIPAADLPHVFERFHRGSNVVGKIEGTGIGLAGAKQIVEQHGGTVSVESQEGAGAAFTVVLPLTPPAVDAAG